MPAGHRLLSIQFSIQSLDRESQLLSRLDRWRPQCTRMTIGLNAQLATNHTVMVNSSLFHFGTVAVGSTADFRAGKIWTNSEL